MFNMDDMDVAAVWLKVLMGRADVCLVERHLQEMDADIADIVAVLE